jgi:membrane protein DedA with SNARE-associated domain
MKAGRKVFTASGPLRSMRMSAVRRGDDVFKRMPVVAVLLTPSWIAGIHHVRAAVFLPTNVLSALAWALGIGLGAFYVGPTIVEFVDDLGLAIGGALGLLVAAVVAGEIILHRRRRRKRDREEATAPDQNTV